MAETVLQVDHVSKYFAEKRTVVDLVRGRKQKYLKAVDDVSFSIEKGQNLGLVGESGCGKSTLAKCVLRLYKPTKGRIVLDGTDITSLEGEALRNMTSSPRCCVSTMWSPRSRLTAVSRNSWPSAGCRRR